MDTFFHWLKNICPPREHFFIPYGNITLPVLSLILVLIWKSSYLCTIHLVRCATILLWQSDTLFLYWYEIWDPKPQSWLRSCNMDMFCVLRKPRWLIKVKSMHFQITLTFLTLTSPSHWKSRPAFWLETYDLFLWNLVRKLLFSPAEEYSVSTLYLTFVLERITFDFKIVFITFCSAQPKVFSVNVIFDFLIMLNSHFLI